MIFVFVKGAPVDVSPDHDDPVLAADPQRNNNFDFSSVSELCYGRMDVVLKLTFYLFHTK